MALHCPVLVQRPVPRRHTDLRSKNVSRGASVTFQLSVSGSDFALSTNWKDPRGNNEKHENCHAREGCGESPRICGDCDMGEAIRSGRPGRRSSRSGEASGSYLSALTAVAPLLIV